MKTIFLLGLVTISLNGLAANLSDLRVFNCQLSLESGVKHNKRVMALNEKLAVQSTIDQSFFNSGKNFIFLVTDDNQLILRGDRDYAVENISCFPKQ